MWMNLTTINIKLNKRSQTQKITHCKILITKSLKTGKINLQVKMVVALAWWSSDWKGTTDASEILVIFCFFLCVCVLLT